MPPLEGTCSLRAGTAPALGVPSGLRRPVHTGAPGGASRTRTEGSRSGARCPHGPFWTRAQRLPGRPGVYPRSRQQGAPFRLGARGCGGRRCAAPRCAPARTGPGPLDAASPLLLPAGRAPAAGERGAAGAAARGRPGPGEAGGGSGGAGSSREGGRAEGPAGSSSPTVPWKRRPGLPAPVPGCAAELGAQERGSTGRGGEGSSGPLCQLGGARRQGRVALSLGEGLRAWRSPGGPELRGGGCSLRDRGLLGARPRPPPPRPSERASEALRKAAGTASTSAEPFIPPSDFTLSLPGRQRAPLKGAAARRLAKQWRPRFPDPLPGRRRWG